MGGRVVDQFITFYLTHLKAIAVVSTIVFAAFDTGLKYLRSVSPFRVDNLIFGGLGGAYVATLIGIAIAVSVNNPPVNIFAGDDFLGIFIVVGAAALVYAYLGSYPYDASWVCGLQSSMTKLGFYNGRRDGVPGVKTRRAIIWMYRAVDAECFEQGGTPVELPHWIQSRIRNGGRVMFLSTYTALAVATDVINPRKVKGYPPKPSPDSVGPQPNPYTRVATASSP